ncbi:hypothetical protein HK101_011598 [Irineochytrium annulatum]|nr:hypothetical protein HK101_011598 [Irineochytrium annulatum]
MVYISVTPGVGRLVRKEQYFACEVQQRVSGSIVRGLAPGETLIRRPHSRRRVAGQALQLLSVIASALMIYKSLSLAMGTDSPLVVVLTGSMEPAFHRGDLLFLTHPRSVLDDAPLRVGDVCVFKIKDKPTPIVHRVVAAHDDERGGGDGKGAVMLTKGDHNLENDRALYAPGQLWIRERDVVGRVRGIVPYIGYVSVLLNENAMVKTAVLGAVGLMALLS